MKKDNGVDWVGILEAVFEKASKTEIAAACTKAGLRVTKQAVGQWTRVPDEKVRVVAELTGLPLKRIRPDLYDSTYRAAAVS